MHTWILAALALAGSLAANGSFAAENGAGDATNDERVIRTTEGFSRERAADELRDVLTLKESRISPDRVIVKQKTGGPSTVQSAIFGDAYVYEAVVDLFYDLDVDGYYHYLRVQFDADTLYDSMLIYAEIYLSADGQAWEHLFTTEDFRIWGSDPDDDYEVESELVSGYSTGHYDLLIELYEASSGDLLDEFGPLESSALSLLPLEDSTRDGVVAPPPHSDSGGGRGAVSWAAIAALLAGVVAVRRRRNRSA